MSLTIGVPRETFAGEKRVATVPEVVEKLVKLGFGVAIERGAGASANFEDEAYQAAGARVVGGALSLLGAGDFDELDFLASHRVFAVERIAPIGRGRLHRQATAVPGRQSRL